MSADIIKEIACNNSITLTDGQKTDNTLSIFMNGQTYDIPVSNNVFSERKFIRLLDELKSKFGKVHMWTKNDLTIRNG